MTNNSYETAMNFNSSENTRPSGNRLTFSIHTDVLDFISREKIHAEALRGSRLQNAKLEPRSSCRLTDGNSSFQESCPSVSGDRDAAMGAVGTTGCLHTASPRDPIAPAIVCATCRVVALGLIARVRIPAVPRQSVSESILVSLVSHSAIVLRKLRLSSAFMSSSSSSATRKHLRGRSSPRQ